MPAICLRLTRVPFKRAPLYCIAFSTFLRSSRCAQACSRRPFYGKIHRDPPLRWSVCSRGCPVRGPGAVWTVLGRSGTGFWRRKEGTLCGWTPPAVALAVGRRERLLCKKPESRRRELKRPPTFDADPIPRACDRASDGPPAGALALEPRRTPRHPASGRARTRDGFLRLSHPQRRQRHVDSSAGPTAEADQAQGQAARSTTTRATRARGGATARQRPSSSVRRAPKRTW